MSGLQVITRDVTDEAGNLLEGAQVTIRVGHEEGGALATIYSDEDGESAITNPVTLDGASDGSPAPGQLQIYAEHGLYRLEGTGAAGVGFSLIDTRSPNWPGSVADISSLKSLNVEFVQNGSVIEVVEYRSGSGVGGGTFVYDADSSATRDAGMVIAPLTGSGRFLRQTDRITPQVFGSPGAMKSPNPATPYLLSDYYATLAAAQADYPKATALTQTIDDMACQAMVDHLRGSFFFAKGGQEVNRNTVNNFGQKTAYVFPRGEYYLTRPLDMTKINAGHTFWGIHGEGAVIMGCVPGKTIIDLIGARKCVFTGTAVIVGVWTEDGVSRSAIQIGRAADGLASDSHSFEGGWEIKGRFSLAGVHNYASEDVRLGALSIKNDLDPRVYHCQFDSSDAVLEFAPGETITWSGGASSGFVKYKTSDKATGGVGISLLTGSAPVNNDVIIGATSTKSATINGSPKKEPSGEGVGGRSFCLVQDGDNYWGIQSDYQSNPTTDTAASFLRNVGNIDLRHTGKGGALWISRPGNHDYRNSYFVTDDPDNAAAVTAFSNTGTDVLKGCLFDVHVESDGGDLDPATGLDFGFLFDSATADRDIVVSSFLYRRNVVHPAVAEFFTSTNVSTVTFISSEIEVERVSRDVGQLMFGAPGKFRFYGGKISCGTNGDGPFFNISGMLDISGSDVVCENIASSNVRHPTGRYILRDNAGGMVLHNGIDEGLNVKGDAAAKSSIMSVKSSADGAVIGRMSYDGGNNQWVVANGGTDNTYIMSPLAIYPEADNTNYVGIASRRFARGYFTQTFVTAYRDLNGVKVLGEQQPAISNSVGGDEQAKINDILAKLRNHGIIAT